MTLSQMLVGVFFCVWAEKRNAVRSEIWSEPNTDLVKTYFLSLRLSFHWDGCGSAGRGYHLLTGTGSISVCMPVPMLSTESGCVHEC